MSTTDGWLKLNFASCVIRQTRSLGVLVLSSIFNKVFVNYIYDMVADTQFEKILCCFFVVYIYVKSQQLIWIFFQVPLTLSLVTGRRLDYTIISATIGLTAVTINSGLFAVTSTTCSTLLLAVCV